MAVLTHIACLALALNVAALPPVQPQDEQLAAAIFLPSHHGFQFHNSFTGTPIPPLLRGLGLEGAVPDTFGLCGGMSLAACDLYLTGAVVPADTKPPREGTPLYAYIYRRQTDSLGTMGVMAAKFAQWMLLPDTSETGDSTAGRTAGELPAILARLERGELVPLGLVYAKADPPDSRSAGNTGRDRLWENHQVLAYGLASVHGHAATANAIAGDRTNHLATSPPLRIEDNAPDTQTDRPDAHSPCGPAGGANSTNLMSREIRIYDPNYPGDDRVVLRFRPVDGGITTQLVTGTGRSRRVRGVFPMPYTRVKPPESLSAPRREP
ncbi:MAG: hypothetical protein JNK25_08165 [Phycisphaerae bacterium]|nr:hypothetical protein [Phycisphaerae bacterium]